MTDRMNQSVPTNGNGASHSGVPASGNGARHEAAPPAVPAAAVAGGAAAPTEAVAATRGSDAASGVAMVREAISLIKEHPLGAVATVAAATALVELPFAVGVLAGVGATALLVNKSGPERRKLVLERGKWALERARAMKAMAKKTRRSVASAPPASPV